MRVIFTNPCPTGTISYTFSSSKIKYDVTRGTSIVCPYDGVVHTNRNDVITILHDIDGDSWESILTDIRPIVGVGQTVRKGSLIGATTLDKFKFEVSVIGGGKLSNLETLITTGIESRNVKPIVRPDDDDSDNDDDDSDNDNDDDDDDDDNYTPTKDATRGFLKMLLSPISFAQGALGLNSDSNRRGLREETQRKIDLIKEDIDRMKKLF